MASEWSCMLTAVTSTARSGPTVAMTILRLRPYAATTPE